MKIIKNKKKEFGVQEFSCETCGSVFTDSDYSIHKSFIELDYSIFKGYKIQFSVALVQWCPVCKSQCDNHIPTDEPPFWTHSPYRRLSEER